MGIEAITAAAGRIADDGSVDYNQGIIVSVSNTTANATVGRIPANGAVGEGQNVVIKDTATGASPIVMDVLLRMMLSVTIRVLLL